MEKATDKQIWFLKNKGIDASNMDKSAAIALIEQIKGKSDQSSEKPKFQPRFQPKQPNPSSYYVSYAKDMFCALIALDKNKNVGHEIIMDWAIANVKKAIEEFS